MKNGKNKWEMISLPLCDFAPSRLGATHLVPNEK
jgi:hypothetical protein